MTLSLPLFIALALVAWLTAGAMAVRSVSRIWLRHWAERQLRVFNANRDIVEVVREIAEATEVAAEPEPEPAAAA